MGNYNLKNIAFGIGIGIIISSIINISFGSRELSIEDIKMEAAKHNLIVLTKEEILKSQTPSDNPAVTPEKPSAPAAEQVPQAHTEPAQVQKNSAGIITIEIVKGMNSEDVTMLLKEKGVINDTRAFLKRLEELDKENKLQIGSFKIPEGSGFDDIINIIAN